MSADHPIPRDWAPGRNAVRFERADRENARGACTAIHGSCPFVTEFDTDDALDGAAFRSVAHAYLTALDDFLGRTSGDRGLGLPEGWLEALGPQAGQTDLPLRWLDIWHPRADGEGGEHQPPRLGSWRLMRNAVPGPEGSEDPEGPDRLAGATIVMVAAEDIRISRAPQIVGVGFGLRVPMAVSPRPGGGSIVSVRSMTAEFPYRPYRSLTEVMAIRRAEKAQPFDPARTYLDRLDASIRAHDLALAASLQLTNLVYDDFRLRWRDVGTVPEFQAVELLGKGVGAGDSLPYSFMVELVPGDDEGGLVPIGATKRPLVTHADAAGVADIFDPEPPVPGGTAGSNGLPPELAWSSWRPTRSEAELEGFRTPSRIGDQALVSLETDDFKVRNCPDFVSGDPDSLAARTVALPAGEALPVRSNDFSAISAYVNCRRFFEIVGGFGIPLDSFVVAAQRQLQVFYRSGMGPNNSRKNGETINARVVIDPAPAVGRGFRNAPQLPTIAVHLALGNLTHRSRRVDGSLTPVRAEPLGMAASGRWMWHEFGHVLVAARLGQLEFDFAHSAGDGMAAVMADPFSPLADPREKTGFRFRGITFPWVFATRRHDRSVSLGWAWGGALNRSLLAAPAPQRAGPKGYLTEQILSSTLFRLYRVLGGDTVRAAGAPNHALRERASFVTLFLLIEAVRSMAQSPSVAEMLEIAMEGADIDLTTPLLFAPLKPRGPLADDETDAWIGGRAHKAVRWAFEAQGMFAPDREVDHNAPGRPMPVDLYIADRRPSEEAVGGGAVDHRPGGYVPVSLDWDGERRWQGHPAALSTSPFQITLGNRGDQAATGLRLRVWLGIASGDPAASDWDMGENITWSLAIGPIELDTVIPALGTVRTEVEIEDELSPVPAAAVGLLLVEVSCPDDRANSDPAALYATAVTGTPPTVPRHLADLVANDNNLALWQL